MEKNIIDDQMPEAYKIPKLPKLTLRLEEKDFQKAADADKQALTVMRESVSFWKDGVRRFRKNKVAMTSLLVVILVMLFAFIVPIFFPYTYEQQIRGSENLGAFQYSETELARKSAGEFVFPHILGTDNLGRDLLVRLMIGSRVSLAVGLVASFLILVIGSLYGTIAGYYGGKIDMIMMRIVDIIYSVPDILVIILLMVVLETPLKRLGDVPGFEWVRTMGASLISIFLVFALLYWVGMARQVRGQIIQLRTMEYVTAAKALGASNGRIIRKHLLTNSLGTLIVMTTLQIPSAIFTESFLSFLGIGVSAPMPSLGSMAASAIKGIQSYPLRLFAPAILISIIILAFNLLGDALRDSFDPQVLGARP